MATNQRNVKRQRRRGPNNRMGMILICIVLGLVFAVTVARIVTLNKTQAVYNEKVEYYSQLVAKEEKRSEELVEFEKYTQTDAYIEEVAKERFGLVKDGEIIFMAED